LAANLSWAMQLLRLANWSFGRRSIIP